MKNAKEYVDEIIINTIPDSDKRNTELIKQIQEEARKEGYKQGVADFYDMINQDNEKIFNKLFK